MLPMTGHDSKGGSAGLAADNDGNPWDGRTILVVDDKDDFHELMKILMGSTARVESAYNGLKAIEAAHREIPDLILMDLRMPVMNGLDATKRIKSDPATKDIPILAVTAQSADEEGVRIQDGLSDGFVAKPVDFGALRKEMGRVLGVNG